MLLSKQAEQQVCGPDVAMEQPVRLLGGALENTSGGCGEWYFAGPVSEPAPLPRPGPSLRESGV